jgi:hypothetical protein
VPTGAESTAGSTQPLLSFFGGLDMARDEAEPHKAALLLCEAKADKAAHGL